VATIEISTFLNAAPDTVREHIRTSKLLRHVNAGLLSFDPIEPPTLPEHWSEGDYRVRVRLFGFVPLGLQTIGIRDPGPEDDWVVRDEGSGSIARVWDHHIFVTREGAGSRYTDRVRIEAGILTPFVVLFAQLQYRHRQRRWRRLVKAGFRFHA
jgi:hypothetical protein